MVGVDAPLRIAAMKDLHASGDWPVYGEPGETGRQPRLALVAQSPDPVGLNAPPPQPTTASLICFRIVLEPLCCRPALGHLKLADLAEFHRCFLPVRHCSRCRLRTNAGLGGCAKAGSD